MSETRKHLTGWCMTGHHDGCVKARVPEDWCECKCHEKASA